MNNDEYRKFWERFLGRYPEYKPTVEQTEDWRREFRNKDAGILEATVATVVTQKSSTIPKMPWFLSMYNKIHNERAKNSNDKKPDWYMSDKKTEDIVTEKRAHLKQLQRTDIADLRTATITVLRKYGRVLSKPNDGNVENWDKFLRAAVWVELYGDDDGAT